MRRVFARLRGHAFLVLFSVGVIAFFGTQLAKMRFDTDVFHRSIARQTLTPDWSEGASQAGWVRTALDGAAATGTVWMVPVTDDTLYYAVSQRQLFRVSGNGLASKRIGKEFEQSLAVDLRVVIEDSTRHRLYVRATRGLFVSTDRGETWTDISPAGASLLRAFAVGRVANADLVVAISRDQLFMSANGGKEWRRAGESVSRRGPFDGVEVLDSAGHPRIFVASPGGLLRVDSIGVKSEPKTVMAGKTVFDLWTARSKLGSGTVLFASVNGWPGILEVLHGREVRWSRDFGMTWDKMSTPLTADGSYSQMMSALWNASAQQWVISLRLADWKTLFSRDGGKHWSRLELAGGPARLAYDRLHESDGPRPVGYGLTLEGNLAILEFDRKVWHEVKLTLPTAWVRKLAVGQDRAGQTIVFAATDQLLISRDSARTFRAAPVAPLMSECSRRLCLHDLLMIPPSTSEPTTDCSPGEYRIPFGERMTTSAIIEYLQFIFRRPSRVTD